MTEDRLFGLSGADGHSFDFSKLGYILSEFVIKLIFKKFFRMSPTSVKGCPRDDLDCVPVGERSELAEDDDGTGSHEHAWRGGHIGPAPGLPRSHGAIIMRHTHTAPAVEGGGAVVVPAADCSVTVTSRPGTARWSVGGRTAGWGHAPPSGAAASSAPSTLPPPPSQRENDTDKPASS